MKKLNLKNLHVQSFVTSLEGRSGKTAQIAGGSEPGFICPNPTVLCPINTELCPIDTVFCPITRNCTQPTGCFAGCTIDLSC